MSLKEKHKIILALLGLTEEKYSSTNQWYNAFF
jgi:hypothetical protein